MARKYNSIQPSGYTIGLVDDDPDYLEATRRLLESEGYVVLTASDGEQALCLLRKHSVDLLLLDYFMPEMTGGQVVEKLRAFDSSTQVILQTGYANERPPREMLRRFDIQGYYDKSEGPDRLLLWTAAGLKGADAILRLARGRKGLKQILDAAPSMHRIRPLVDLYDGVLEQAMSLAGAERVMLAISADLQESAEHPDSTCVATSVVAEECYFALERSREGSGQTETQCLQLNEGERADLSEVLKTGISIRRQHETVVPLRLGEVVLGGLWIRHRGLRAEADELLDLFAHQVTVAIQNMRLYEMAAMDPLTSVHARRFFDIWTRREVRNAFRTQWPISFLLLDMDGLKSINDTAGHGTGDQALAMIGRVLRQATRENDVVGRVGGDEFAVIFPRTDVDGAERVAERLLAMLRETVVYGPSGAIQLSASLGLATLSSYPRDDAALERPISVEYFQNMTEALRQSADTALYTAKGAGKGRCCTAESLNWAPFHNGDRA